MNSSTSIPDALLRNTACSAVAAFAMVAGRFIPNVVASRLLGPSGAGELVYDLWLVDFLLTVVGFGLQSTITRFCAALCAEGKERTADAITIAIFRSYSVLLMVGILVLTTRAAWQNPGTPFTTWVLLESYFVSQGLASLYFSSLAGRHAFARSARIYSVASLLSIAGVCAGTRYWGISGALGGYLLGAILPAFLSLRLLLTRPHEKLKPELVRRLWRYAFFAWLGALMTAIVWARVEVFFLSIYGGAEQVAMFSVGLSLASLAAQGPLTLCGALLPHFATHASGYSQKEAHRNFIWANKFLASLLFPLGFGAAVVAPTLIPLLYGARFSRAIPTAMVLVATTSIVAVITPSSALIYGLEKSWFHFLGNAPFACLSIGASFILIRKWGVWGAVCQRGIIQAGVVAVVIWYVSTRLRYPFPWRDLMLTALCGAAGAFLLALGLAYVSSAAAVGVLLALSVSVYLCLLSWLRIIPIHNWRMVCQALWHRPINQQ